MALHVASGKTQAAAANTNIIELRATSTVRLRIKELAIFSETAAAFHVAMFRTTVIGTAGTAITPFRRDPADGPAVCTVVTGPTGGVLETVAQERAFLPAVAGSAVIWNYAPQSEILVALSGSLMIRNDGAAGPAFTWKLVWEE